MSIPAAMHAGAARVLARARIALEAEDAAVRAAQADAIRNKTNLHPAYWQRRYAAEQRVRAAEEIVAALAEMDGGERRNG